MTEKRPGVIRVLQAIRQGNVGGGESHMLSLVSNVDRNRFDPVVLSFSEGPMVDRIREMQIPVYVVKTTKPFDIRVWHLVKRIMRNEKIDMVHAHGTRAMSNVFYPARLLAKPIIYSVHAWSFHPDQNFLIHRLRVLSEAFLTSKASKNICVSDSNLQTGLKFLGRFNSDVVHNGIDLEYFNPGKEPTIERSELSLSQDDFVCIFIARFELQKQPLTLIRAFSRLVETYPALKLLMVGDGSLKDQCMELTRNLGLTEKIGFLPFRSDVRELLAISDIYILPSLWEGMPIGLIEAMAMQKVVIATAVDGSCEIVRDKENGFLIQTEPLEDNICQAIKEILNNEDVRKRIGQAARESVLSNFDVKDMTKKIERIYIGCRQDV